MNIKKNRITVDYLRCDKNATIIDKNIKILKSKQKTMLKMLSSM